MPGIKAADAYAVISQVGRNWKRFAREKLELSENEVEDCEYMDRDNLTEQRFQMIQTWIRKNGRHATIGRLGELAGWVNPTEQRHREPRQAASQNYIENTEQSNLEANRSVKVLRTPVSDIPNPMDAWKKAQANVNDVENHSHLPVEATSSSNLMLSEGANTKDQSITASTDTDDANKAFGDVNSAIKANHKRSESESTVISSSSASSEYYDSTSSLKRNGKKGTLSKLKRAVSSRIRKGRKSTSKNTKTFSTEQDSKENVCSRVGKVKVDLVSEEDIQRITSIRNRYCTEKYPGCALILNNSFENDDHQFRVGADEDVNNMEQLWKQMGCEIYGGKAQQEKSAAEMRRILKQIPLLKQRYGYIVVVIMSHGGLVGETTVIRGVDGRNISVTEIETIFNNQSAPRLRNIPKLFFFQFCRGGDFDYGVDVDHMKIEKSFQRMSSVNEHLKRNPVQTDGHKIPTSSDMHFAFATHKYRPAIRSPYYGSWFISAVTNVFMQYARSESVLSMLLRVKEAMMEFSGEYQDEPDGEVQELKSLSWDGGSLIRQLYLLPGYSTS